MINKFKPRDGPFFLSFTEVEESITFKKNSDFPVFCGCISFGMTWTRFDIF